MAQESYSLREASELLGLSPRALQRRIQEGAFPGRYLAPGRQGLETRLTSDDVERALEEQRKKHQLGWHRAPEGTASTHVSQAPTRVDEHALARATAAAGASRSTVTPAREIESLVPYQTPDLISSSGASSSPAMAVTHSDLESLRDAMLAIVREDREMFLAAVRDALVVRDREIVSLRQDIVGMRRTLEAVRDGLEGIGQRLAARRDTQQTIDAQLWADLVEGSAAIVARGGVDVDALLREIAELEAMLAADPD